MNEFRVENAEAMEALGEKIAQSLTPGSIVKITGALGAGKTTLVRGVVAALGGNPDSVHSPTFSLVHEYQIPGNTVKHCDFYRLAQDCELEDFGGLEFFDSDSIFLIEWPERFRLWESITSDRLSGADLQHDSTSRIVSLTPNLVIVD